MGFISQGALVRMLVAASLGVAFSGERLDVKRSIDWTHDAVVAGADVGVTVRSASCYPITITLMIDGVVEGVHEIEDAPTTVLFSVPREAAGKGYKILVTCGSESLVQSGQVV
jgi:hypothetical protein